MSFSPKSIGWDKSIDISIMKHCALICLLISSDILQNQSYPRRTAPWLIVCVSFHVEAPDPSLGRWPGKVDLHSYHFYGKYVNTVHSYQFYGNNVTMFIIINLYSNNVRNFPWGNKVIKKMCGTVSWCTRTFILCMVDSSYIKLWISKCTNFSNILHPTSLHKVNFLRVQYLFTFHNFLCYTRVSWFSEKL